MIGVQLARILYSFVFFGAFTDLQMAIFPMLPGSLTNLYNETFIKHYSITLDAKIYWICSTTVLGSNATWPWISGIGLVLYACKHKSFIADAFLYIGTKSIPDSPKWLAFADGELDGTLVLIPLSFFSTFDIDKIGRRLIVFFAAVIIPVTCFANYPSQITFAFGTMQKARGHRFDPRSGKPILPIHSITASN
ncbi:hypothetical protein KIN20_019443 [Parelaphostrongylus tenuis]|uniref:Uncharacterized protein n=1 Tax=Parelaphostrongylus tenuis TaxID=148309 RepID=A0AAD5ML05_PARTN|nr:hypothetical protein KIN20_019443 [Parelaphostrongylus tenuis]